MKKLSTKIDTNQHKSTQFSSTFVDLGRLLSKNIAIVALVTMVITGCMTPNKAVRESDKAGIKLATEYWQTQTGRTNTFDISRPSDALTLRIALIASAQGETNVVFPSIPYTHITQSNDVLVLSLQDALAIAARNDRQYQKLKESVFSTALDLDYQQYLFDTSFSGMMSSILAGDKDDNLHSSTTANVGFQKKLSNGATIAGRLAWDVVSLLKGDWSSTLAVDLTMSLPLLRGAGRDIVREPLTQAERNLVYSIRSFELYRQTYAVSVASGYFGVLEVAQRYYNAVDNERILEDNFRRAEMLFEAGRMQRIQLDQAKTDYLIAKEGVISQQQSFEARLDSFKITIGLPPEAKIGLDNQELDKLVAAIALSARTAPQEPLISAEMASEIALQNRLDVLTSRDNLEDAQRNLKVAADALRADVSLSAAGRVGETRTSDNDGIVNTRNWNVGVRADAPWDRRRERNAYRRQLILIDQRQRDLEEKEDSVKLSIRNNLRNVSAAQASYKIQVAALEVAKLRVESNFLFLQSGRSSMRDVLDAQSSLLSAQNSLCSSVIRWRISELDLQRDMGILQINDSGMWVERSLTEASLMPSEFSHD